MIPGYYTISQEASDIQEGLTPWATRNGASVDIMAGMRHLWENVYGPAATDKPRILICYTGEQARGGFNQANTLHRVDRQWTVVLMRGHGLKNAMAEQDGDRIPFYDAVEEVRDALRVLVGITTEAPIDFKGIQSMPATGPNRVADVFMDGFTITFSTANDIPAIVFDNPNQQPLTEGETTT